eukprot:923291-Pleurochrysis_carterae.AAC.1
MPQVQSPLQIGGDELSLRVGDGGASESGSGYNDSDDNDANSHCFSDERCRHFTGDGKDDNNCSPSRSGGGGGGDGGGGGGGASWGGSSRNKVLGSSLRESCHRLDCTHSHQTASSYRAAALRALAPLKLSPPHTSCREDDLGGGGHQIGSGAYEATSRRGGAISPSRTPPTSCSRLRNPFMDDETSNAAYAPFHDAHGAVAARSGRADVEPTRMELNVPSLSHREFMGDTRQFASGTRQVKSESPHFAAVIPHQSPEESASDWERSGGPKSGRKAAFSLVRRVAVPGVRHGIRGGGGGIVGGADERGARSLCGGGWKWVSRERFSVLLSVLSLRLFYLS